MILRNSCDKFPFNKARGYLKTQLVSQNMVCNENSFQILSIFINFKGRINQIQVEGVGISELG